MTAIVSRRLALAALVLGFGTLMGCALDLKDPGDREFPFSCHWNRKSEWFPAWFVGVRCNPGEYRLPG